VPSKVDKLKRTKAFNNTYLKSLYENKWCRTDLKGIINKCSICRYHLFDMMMMMMMFT
jgi:hypothetical protein